MYRAAKRCVFTCLRWPQNTIQFRSLHLTRQSLISSATPLSFNHSNLIGNGQFVQRYSSFQLRDDTIYALSTAEGKAGIAVIRISGPACRSIYHGLCPSKPFLKPRHATIRSLYHPDSSESEILDSEALVLFFPNPKTVTGDDVLELHVHGGSATVKAVLAAIPKCAAEGPIRYAEPGEFTKRAFLNDRLDLAQVEALSETLAAETEQQRRAAVRGSSGSLGRTYEDWRQNLLHARAEMEALIDFSEDQHFDESPASLVVNVTKQVRQILQSIHVHEGASERSELLRNGIKIALVGPPNVGKSSFMNQIVGREASIVSGESGTTRDIIEANLDIRGYLCTFADTAGFRSSTPLDPTGSRDSIDIIGVVEKEGIRRARVKATQSDVIIVLTSIETDTLGIPQIRFDMETLKLAADSKERLIIVNKRDTVPDERLRVLLRRFAEDVLGKVNGLEGIRPIPISCKEAQDLGSDQIDSGGLRGVVDALVTSFTTMTSLPATLQDLHGVTERQRQLLVKCRRHLENYLEAVGYTDLTGERGPHDELDGGEDADITMAAEHLRYAANYLGRITGRGDVGDVEEILGVIFEK
ncbi:P-loop containing nucleoside triphosphate hydrolase protein [Daldinia loculata]|uniref:P-loop containing nucleoside triphosphate hydrolase protein n=1 Tax=Daldinia loculata TaxID=103429 RepID=UPI0020C3862D|nr:P-loop containing nucleoside triphosphate hydrolase protein [Daldinia loculata]KAI1648084.1 P-loop containing nucleoside triphosphate hydrolase protein [Daldinia loculata]